VGRTGVYVVMNRLRTLSAHAEHIQLAFRHAAKMDGVAGFVSIELMQSTQAPDETGNVEYVALTRWESRRACEAWAQSEAFDQVHVATDGSYISASRECYDVLQ
jgi:heme-degrading monooxygenase HmoA